MNITAPEFNFKNLETLISRARQRRSLSDLENGLLNIAANAVARAERGAYAETLRCLMAMSEKIDAILAPRSAEVINFPSDFAGQIWHVERKPQRGIWQAAA